MITNKGLVEANKGSHFYYRIDGIFHIQPPTVLIKPISHISWLKSYPQHANNALLQSFEQHLITNNNVVCNPLCVLHIHIYDLV